MVLDRLISGAGAVTDGADRSVRLLTSGSTGSPVATRPGSVAIALVLFSSPACCCSPASRRPIPQRR